VDVRGLGEGGEEAEARCGVWLLQKVASPGLAQSKAILTMGGKARLEKSESLSAGLSDMSGQKFWITAA